MKTKKVERMISDNTKNLSELSQLKGFLKIKHMRSLGYEVLIRSNKTDRNKWWTQITVLPFSNHKSFCITRKGTTKFEAIAKAGLRLPVNKRRL